MNRSAINDLNNDNFVDTSCPFEKSQNIGFFQIKSQIFDFKSKYWPFYAVLLIKLYFLCNF